MYHTSHISQQKQKEKSLLTKSFSYENLQTAYTSSYQRVLKVLLKFAHSPYIYLTNSYIACEAGCSNNTVTRATNQFLKDGLITKHQKNRYAPNHYALTDKVKKVSFSHWINSLSAHNQYLYNTHGIRIDHKNKIICSFEYGEQNKSNLILDNLFINLSPSSRTGVRGFLKKIKDTRRWSPQKGVAMNNFKTKPFVVAKPQEKTVPKRNPGGHSPAVIKPKPPLDDQIHAKKVDIAFFKKQLEDPTSFWDPCSILFSVNVKMAESLLSKAHEELVALIGQKERNSNEKQVLLREYTAYSMATCSA